MNQLLGLRALSEVLGWDDEVSRNEFAWLTLMSDYKYDTYRDYIAGSRFIESLVKWLQQFNPDDRQEAYAFVRRRLIFIGDSEMQRLIESFFPRTVFPKLLSDVAAVEGIRDFEVLHSRAARDLMTKQLRSTIFMALSDGARIDGLRRANHGRVLNDQVFMSSRLEPIQWLGARDFMKKETQDDGALLETIYLIDDFTASGTTFCRIDPDTNQPNGKIVKFVAHLQEVKRQLLAADAREVVFSEGLRIRCHHLVASAYAAEKINSTWDTAVVKLKDRSWIPSVEFSYGTVLPASMRLDDVNDAAFLKLCDSDAYYDPAIQDPNHARQAGTKEIRRGYGNSQLPLVLYHNTPNNTVPLVWAESEAGAKPLMRPLFRRRQRHG